MNQPIVALSARPSERDPWIDNLPPEAGAAAPLDPKAHAAMEILLGALVGCVQALDAAARLQAEA